MSVFPNANGCLLTFDEVAKATNYTSAPKWTSRVSIYEKSKARRLIATLNLQKLGRRANMKRHCGLICDIYVLELSDQQQAPIDVRG